MLQLRCTKNGRAIKVEWAKVKWYGSKAKGTRKAIREYIRKGTGVGYNLNTLLRLCKEWEKPLVEDTVKKLTEICREAAHVNKALQQIRLATAGNKTKGE